MAAKRKQKSSLSPWMLATAAVGILVVAAVALLSDRRLSIPPESQGVPAVDLGRDMDEDHDRDQIDQASRDELRDILRAAGASDSEDGS